MHRGDGGGIEVVGLSSVEILDNVISNHHLFNGIGGGISLFEAGSPVIRGNMITDNSAFGLQPCSQGGGVWVAGQFTGVIAQNVIMRNSAVCGAAILEVAAGK
jgi:Right handed beta helix region